MSPYLGYSAPTNRPAEGPGLWASPDMPRIVAARILEMIGIDWPQSLPAIAFANALETKMNVTRQYSLPPDDELYRPVRLEERVHALRPLDGAGLKRWRARTKSSTSQSGCASWPR